MAEKYFLRTERLGFGKWDENMYFQAEVLWGDSNVTRLIGGKLTEKDIHKRVLLEISNGNKYGVQYWPIFKLENDEFIGCCGLRPYNLDKKIYEIGFHISSKFWRQGFAFEAAKATICYAFNVLNVKSLFAGHNPNNIASGKLLEKLGFKYSHDEFYAPTGLRHPSYILKG